MKINNFKEIKVTPNEDGTVRITYCGVMLNDVNGDNVEPATVTYPRVRIRPISLDFSTKTIMELEVLPDFKDRLIKVCI